MRTMRTLPNYLKMHRKRRGFSQREVAALLGCRYGSTVSRYERGIRIPSLADTLAFEVIYGAPARELFAGAFEGACVSLRDRARRLSRELDAKPFTPLIKRKMDSLVDVLSRRDRRSAA